MPAKARPTTRIVDVFVEIPKGEIETFFATYKTLEGDVPLASGWRGAAAAWTAIEAARKRARPS